MEIPEIKGFKEEVLMMVIDDDDYGKRVPSQLGTLHIDQIITQVTPEELLLWGRHGTEHAYPLT